MNLEAPIFDADTNERLSAEINEAYRNKQARAAMGSIVRRNVQLFSEASTYRRNQWLRDVGLPSSFYTEIMKEIAVWKYNRLRLDNDC